MEVADILSFMHRFKRCQYVVLVLILVLSGCEKSGETVTGAPVAETAKEHSPQLSTEPSTAVPVEPPAWHFTDWLDGGKGRFTFTEWKGPAIPVWTYIPTGAEAATLPIAIVMHGTGRDGDRYMEEWAPVAEANRFIAIVPEFSRQHFDGATGYNLGYVFSDETRQRRRDEALWSFSAIEPLFTRVVDALNSDQTHYTLYGHSAGSQFVHRFLFYKPEARVKRFIPANAGWYTLPDTQEPYPYGLLGAGVSEAALKAALQRDVTVLLGDRDIDIAHSSLRRTPEAMRQGENRFERGHVFFERARAKADELGVAFGWQLDIVPGAEHSNRQMAVAAGQLVE
ncbi:hypothetical protein FKG94_00225 [Exilibacterium tricleocarpae]|uniref:Alpha/beta hydrolase n=1 Tax=Exilibacterium tricleocarpae TaxID=2591008 RepID=A0A545UBG0_9GAMM|nr:hypothetical protein [Exilibacterium tricleocarpae]TQV86806.1 hypothetical protein FKG94_00225 [Exilibacterium tricleocarpae]